MAMSKPLVTFGLTGIGEYIYKQEEETKPGIFSELYESFLRHLSIPATAATNSKSSQFTVAPNAVIVNEASPDAVASAVAALIDDPYLGQRIGALGRKIVEDEFNVVRQSKEYENLYNNLLEAAHTKDPH